MAYVSILHHFRALHLFFPVYTLHIASNNRAQKTWHYLCLKEYGQSHRPVKDVFRTFS
ncbi:hypothetical protein CIT292_10617 [Citrobacter youngae ATCC 29220]|uniref:Uncharacterized protein n=1 Tax=Citrobacter youngae ATCC 29220 TaxID=500640 RepID=D4BK01_9ENTR|nr:hypothetical protein CIT292_10617 [Citrobacter youngae ATCC 29220]